MNLLGMLFYIFAVVGMFLYGGKIRKGMDIFTEDSSIPVNYHLMNFNDFISSFITLFALMVVNNWYVIVKMDVEAVGNNNFYRLFFILFWYFTVVIGINLVVAYVLDMYSSIERLEKERNETLRTLDKEMKG
jgi:hypothetical protein